MAIKPPASPPVSAACDGLPGGRGGGISPPVPGWELCSGGSPALGPCTERLSLGKVMDPAWGLPDLKRVPR